MHNSVPTADCPTVPQPANGTVGHYPHPSDSIGTAGGTACGTDREKALARLRFLRGRQRDAMRDSGLPAPDKLTHAPRRSWDSRGADSDADRSVPEPELASSNPTLPRTFDDWSNGGDAGIPRRYQGTAQGSLVAGLARPVSWDEATARPIPGCWCRCCVGVRWWGDMSGWRCWTCHPPDGLTLGTFEEVRT